MTDGASSAVVVISQPEPYGGSDVRATELS